MLVAATLSLSTTGILGAVAGAIAITSLLGWLLAVWVTRRRTKQARTATHLFRSSERDTWQSQPSKRWSEDERDTALRYYNTVGRQARIGGIRVDLVPEPHQRNVIAITAELGGDDNNGKWSDLMWLGNRLKRTSKTATVEPTPEPGDEDTASATAAHAEAHDLASALGMNGASVDINEIEDVSADETPHHEEQAVAAAVGGTGAATSTAPSETISTDPRSPSDPRSVFRHGAVGDAAPDAPLPNVPAWILEARAALPSTLEEELSQESASTSKSVLAGSDFPWPMTPGDAADEVPEPVDFIPDVDLTEMDSALDDAAPDPSPAEVTVARGSIRSSNFTSLTATVIVVDTEDAAVDQPAANPEHDTTTGDGDGDTIDLTDGALSESEPSTTETLASDTPGPDSEARVAQIDQLRRKAKKAKRRAKSARYKAVLLAHEGRPRRARVAATTAIEEAKRAKRLKKRASKLAKHSRDLAE